jgi:hypothetical protein
VQYQPVQLQVQVQFLVDRAAIPDDADPAQVQ